MGNKFIILTPAYKVGKWVEMYACMLKFQTYKNFEVYFVDDASPDNTVELLSKAVDGDSRFHIHVNEERIGSPLGNIIKGFDLANPKDEDIIVNIDGDDWLSSVFVLDYINSVYTMNPDYWLTYGTAQLYPQGNLIGHVNIPMPDSISDTNSYKKYPFITSHLRTYKAGLFKKIDRSDFIDKRTGKIYQEASDLALMFPMLEMAGKDKMIRIEDPTYILNRENALNEANVNLQKQKETEFAIRTQQKVYERLHTL